MVMLHLEGVEEFYFHAFTGLVPRTYDTLHLGLDIAFVNLKTAAQNMNTKLMTR